jgi:signal transduction histidine kinase
MPFIKIRSVLMNQLVYKSYSKIYRFVAAKRIVSQDLAERHIHTHLICILSTGVLMWAYALLAFLTIDHPLPWMVGVAASFVHLFSPLLFRINNKLFFNTNVFLAAGIAHQATFAYFCGGFNSNIIIWLGILPMLAGVICGKRGILVWAIITTLVTSLFLFLKISGFIFPNLITPTGLLFSQALITFGWIYVGSVVIWAFVSLVENHEKEIEAKKSGIQNLICVITHDISNPLTIILARVKSLLRADLSPDHYKSIEKVSFAANNIHNIVQNVLTLYASETGKKRLELTEVNAVDVLYVLKDNFTDQLAAKEINLDFFYNVNPCLVRTNEHILLYQILGNLLSNAIKFSNIGSEILLRLEKTDEHFKILIKDSGIGIPSDLLDKIYDITAETNRIGTSGEVGTGFGLSIVKNYVEILGGKIQFKSIPEIGTTVTLEFNFY